MRTFSYTNTNGDTVLVVVSNGNLIAVYLFGFDILKRLNDNQKQYALRQCEQ